MRRLRVVVLAMPLAMVACGGSMPREGSQRQFTRSSELASVQCTNGSPFVVVTNPTSTTVTVTGYVVKGGARVLQETAGPGTASFQVPNETGHAYYTTPRESDGRRVSLRIDCR